MEFLSLQMDKLKVINIEKIIKIRLVNGQSLMTNIDEIRMNLGLC